MAYGQIDPARLEGDALRRWYLRSPADIEEERRSAAAQCYDRFFSDDDRPAQDMQRERLILQPSTGDFSGTHSRGRFAGPEAWPQDVSWSDKTAPQHAAVNQSASSASSHATPESCVTCHGRLPPRLPPLPLPPPFGPFPWPIGPFPQFRDIPGARPERPDRDRKQCEMQELRDRGICSQQPTEKARAVCNETASERRVHCDSTGEIGEPDLFRARRNDGRPWP